MKNRATLPSAAYLRERINYNPDDGSFTWLEKKVHGVHEKKWNTRHAGKPAGGVQIRKGDGYPVRLINLDGNLLRAHRIAWKIITGDEPPELIDHLNGDSTDNRWCNLGRGDDGRNSLNRSRSRKSISGISGLTWNKRSSKWVARVQIAGRSVYIGSYKDKDIDIAIMELMEKRAELGFTKRHGVKMSPYLVRADA